jgi:photosynthetic reaction center H subunit
MDPERSRVAPLNELDDYKVAEGDPDVRGWVVLGADGQRIGKVDELLADTVAMKVRYLDVEVDDDLLETREERHVLIPIGYARLDRDEDRIYVDALNASAVAALPEYTRGSMTRDDETRLRTHFDREYAAGAPASEDFYEHDLYDEDRFFASRRGTERRARELSESEREQFGEFGRGVEGDGVSPEDDLDHVHGP